MKTLEESFNYLEKNKKISLNNLLFEFKDVGLAFIGLILVLPSALPIPATYYSTPIGVIIFLIGLSFLFDKNIFPKKLLYKEIRVSKIKKIHLKLKKIIKFLDKIIKKRFEFIFNKYLLAFSIMILATVMIIPYPLTDTLPAISLLLIFFSIINEDGFIFLLGIFCGFFSIFVAFLAIKYGYIVIKEIISNLINYH